jgi:6-phosphogluconolactonase/glucosamine-6-phosphate isomerase/deaminase
VKRVVVTNEQGATDAIASGLDHALSSGMNVLWLLSGGSNIPVELDVLRRLHNVTPENLTISLIDERFVDQNSPDSNWRQLLDGGLGDAPVTLLPVIEDPTLSLRAVAANFAKRLGAALEKADAAIGQFGIGADGHTAGILPHSPAVDEGEKLTIGYSGTDFKRITTTTALFRMMDLVTLVAFGAGKHEPLKRMLAEEGEETDTPAKALLDTKELIIYTDQEVSV